jgi:hypothetical protein
VICHYVCCVSVICCLHAVIWLVFQERDSQPNPAGSVHQKLISYVESGEQYDLLFVGDSRTYCGLDPQEIDPKLGTRSLNLANFAHWLPTQYPAFERLIPKIPEDTTVVWSLGSNSFHPAGDRRIQNTYPVGIKNIPRYAQWGYSLAELWPNIAYFSTRDWPARILGKIKSLQTRTLWNSEDASLSRDAVLEADGAATARWQELQNQLASEPANATVEVLRDVGTGVVTSLAAITERGVYRRYEVIPEYFRDRQTQLAEKLHRQAAPDDDGKIVADEQYWETFLAILDLFRKYNVTLIVNEIPEAPFVYASSDRAVAYRRFLRGPVRECVLEYGFQWIVADTAEFGDEDFFDYNHLNHHGISKYAQSMADSLRPRLSELRSAIPGDQETSGFQGSPASGFRNAGF